MKLFITSILLLLFTVHAVAQDEGEKNEETKVSKLISSQNYTFTANTAMPQRGRTIPLTSTYDLRVTKDSVICYLPYFGRAFTAPIDPRSGGINFTSTEFGYSAKRGKKKGWRIEITPQDNSDVRRLYLSVSEDGWGTLQVQSNNRQPISFSGQIKAE